MAKQERKRLHPIGIVSRRTGLKPDLLRAWERRYEAVRPLRTATNRRYYTDEQVERLQLLRRATAGGRRIGQIAEMELEELRDLVESDEAALGRRPGSAVAERSGPSAEAHVGACLDAVYAFDARALQAELERALMNLPHMHLLERVVVPLMAEIGRRWELGEARIAHEHLTTSVLNNFLWNLLNSSAPDERAPRIVVGTPAGQLHEGGALIAAVVAAMEGWQAVYLGTNLPAEELAAAARMRDARALALSITYPEDDPRLRGELRRLLRLVDEPARVVVGGRAAPSYDDVLIAGGAVSTPDIVTLRNELRLLRGPAKVPAEV